MTPEVGAVYRHVMEPKYTMTIVAIRNGEGEDGMVVWDGIHGKGYETPLERFEGWMGEDGEFWVREKSKNS